jgi:hypothetical protein
MTEYITIALGTKPAIIKSHGNSLTDFPCFSSWVPDHMTYKKIKEMAFAAMQAAKMSMNVIRVSKGNAARHTTSPRCAL